MSFPSVVRKYALYLAAAGLCVAADTRKLTLTEAIDLALKNNHAIAIGAARTDEMKSLRRKAAADYYPQVSNTSTYTRLTNTDVLQFAQGSFGNFPGLGSLPSENLKVAQGNQNEFLVRTQIGQPVTQLFKIREGERVARADQRVAEADLEGLRERIALAVRQLYYGLLSAQLDQKVALEQVHVAEEQITESEQDVKRGEALEVSMIEARTRLLEAKQSDLSVRIRHSDVLAQFNNVVGLPPSTQVEAAEQVDVSLELPDKEACVRLAQAAAPEITSAEETVKKAVAGVRAARLEYVPDVTVFARHDYQDGIAFLFHNYGVLGAEFKYTLFDGGRKRAVVDEREAQRTQAVENLRRLKDDAAANVEKALGKIEESRSLIEVAKQVVELRAESERLAVVQFGHGVIVSSKRSETSAALAKARADLVKAELGNLQSQAELYVLIGRIPR
jgi:outer membrane protein TolC